MPSVTCLWLLLPQQGLDFTGSYYFGCRVDKRFCLPLCFCLAGSSVRLPIYLIYNCSTKLDQLSYLIDPENSPEQCLNLSLRTSWNILTWAGVVVVCSGLWSLLQTTWNPSHSSMFCEGYLNRIRIILGPFHAGWSLLSPSLERSISLGLFL